LWLDLLAPVGLVDQLHLSDLVGQLLLPDLEDLLGLLGLLGLLRLVGLEGLAKC
jgi:hypothetical protein